tara:strand:+ start:215 stop:889 length:675 start_codon:yes stop_codon:yes gene_type:complete
MSGGVSKSESQSQTAMNEQQMAQKQALWSQMQQLAPQQQGRIRELGFLGDDLSQGMQGMFQNLGQTAAGTSQAMQGLGAMGQVGGGNPYLMQNMDALGAGINKQLGYANQGLGVGAVQSGGFGGGRQGVAQGMLMGEGLDAFQQGASSLLNQSSQQSLAANQAMGGLQNQAALGGMQGAGNIFEMGMNPLMAQWLPLQMQSGLLGGNIMDSSSSASSMSVSGGA